MDAYDGEDFSCDVAIPRDASIDVVHEDEEILAFHHTRPFWPVHIVVVPKRHVASLLTLDDLRLAAHLLGVVQQVASDVERTHGAASVVTNLGDDQDSKHLHVHVRSGEPIAQRSGKLVRDRVPERVLSTGGAIDTERLGDDAFGEALRAKLVEEAREVVDAPDRASLVEELADVHEVLSALAAHAGIDVAEIAARAESKRATHGGFDRRLRTVRFEERAD